MGHLANRISNAPGHVKESNRYLLGPPAPTVFINDGAPPVIFLILLGLGLVVSAGAVALIGKILFTF